MYIRPGVDENVIRFINDFSSNFSPHVKIDKDAHAEAIRYTFEAGYCYYFAHILKLAFNRGEVCWAVPFGHMVWVDTNGIPYDIEGHCLDREFTDFVPESHMTHNMVADFKHTPGVAYKPPTESEIEFIYEKFKHKNSILWNISRFIKKVKKHFLLTIITRR